VGSDGGSGYTAPTPTSPSRPLAHRRRTQRGGHVTLLCQRRRIEAHPPFLPRHVDPADPAWARVDVRYVDSARDVRATLARLHVDRPDPLARPSALLLDDLVELARLSAGDSRHGLDAELEATLAFLVDAAAWCGQAPGDRLPRPPPCAIVAAITTAIPLGPTGDDWTRRWVTGRWLPCAAGLAPEPGGMPGEDVRVRLFSIGADGAPDATRAVAHLYLCSGGRRGRGEIRLAAVSPAGGPARATLGGEEGSGFRHAR